MIQPGVVINDRYRVLRLLGEGGMGAVFEAEHTAVGRRVAIKVLHPDYARSADIVERFQREARSAAAIGHDNIIDVFDFGTHEGAPYMAMEFLRGESLGHRLEKERAIEPHAAARIMGQVLSGLGAAHASGIVHRDLKPDNVYLIQKSGITDFVKLLDFGISKFKGDSSSKSGGKGLTQTGAMMGTPYYMSPEQALAKSDIDHRADIYSAGVMLYQMLTGSLPFDAESQAELLMAIVYRPNGVKSPSDYVPTLPPELEQVVLKAMAKDRADRYQDAAAFAEALAPWITSALPVPVAAHAMPQPAAGGSAAVGIPTPMAGIAKGGQTLTPLNWNKDAPIEPNTFAPTRSGGAGRWIAVAGAVAVLGGGGAFVALGRGSNPAPDPTVRAASPTTQVAAVAPWVSIDLDQVPAGSTIYMDGSVMPSPHIALRRGVSVLIRVTAPGKLPYESRIVADRDRAITVAMLDEPPAAPVAAAAVAAPAPAAAPQGRHAGRHTAPVAGPSQPTEPPRQEHRPAPSRSPLLAPSTEF